MIVSFGNKTTQRIWDGERAKGLTTDLLKTTRIKLRMLNNSVDIKDLTIPPSNRLEKLKGDLKHFYSIWVNNKWRMLFRRDN